MILSVILTTPQNIDAALKIYRLSGDVKIKQPSGLSVLQRRDAVKPSDKLVIPAGSKVEILDSESRRILIVANEQIIHAFTCFRFCVKI